MMHATFYWGKELTLLINSWRSESWTSYALILLICFVVSVLYQNLEALTMKLNDAVSEASPISEPLLVGRKIGRKRTARILSAVLFGVNKGVGFLVMLAVMSYNGGVFVAVVLGLTVGYYLFRSGGGGEGEGDECDGDDLVGVSNNV